MINYTEEEILAMLKDEQKTNEFLSTLTGEDLKRILIYINSRVRNIPFEENDIYNGQMYAGELISPNNDIQNRFFDKMISALKNINGNRYKATVMHYLVNELHLFGDGNGRTGRCIFELLTNPDFSFENNNNFSHKKGNVGTDKFEELNGINYFENALEYPSFLVYKALVKNGIINQSTFKDCLKSRTSYFHSVFDTGFDNVYISEDIRKQLSSEQIKQINLALCDNNDSEDYTPSGLTMMILQKNIKNEKEVIDGYSQYITEIDKDDEESIKTFSGWSKSDYLKAVKISSLIKEAMLDAMLDIFESPQNFTLNDNKSIASKIADEKESEEFYEVTMLCSQNAKMNFNGTRVQETISKIREIMELQVDMEHGDLMKSAIDATETQTRTSEINQTGRTIKTIQQERTRQSVLEKDESKEQ